MLWVDGGGVVLGDLERPLALAPTAPPLKAPLAFGGGAATSPAAASSAGEATRGSAGGASEGGLGGSLMGAGYT